MTLHSDLLTVNKLRRAHRSMNLYGSLDPEHLRRAVTKLITHHGSMYAAAKVTGVSITYLWHLRNGTRDNPSINILRKLGLAK